MNFIIYLREKLTKIPVYVKNLVTIIYTGIRSTLLLANSTCKLILEKMIRPTEITLVMGNSNDVEVSFYKYRLLGQMDNLSLADFDSMALGAVDLIKIE